MSNFEFFKSYHEKDLQIIYNTSKNIGQLDDQYVISMILTKDRQFLSAVERENFSSSAKKVLEKFRTSLKIVSLVKASSSEDQFSLFLASYASSKIFAICFEILNCLNSLFNNLNTKYLSFTLSEVDLKQKSGMSDIEYYDGVVSYIFYTKMQADYYRYIIESLQHCELIFSDAIKEMREKDLKLSLTTPEASNLSSSLDPAFKTLNGSQISSTGNSTNTVTERDLQREAIEDKCKRDIDCQKKLLITLQTYFPDVANFVSIVSQLPSLEDDKESWENINEKAYSDCLDEIKAFLANKMNELASLAEEKYKISIQFAEKYLRIKNHHLLGPVLNYAVFLYEIKNHRDQAIYVASKYYHDGIKELIIEKDSDDYDKTNMILLLIKDNIDGWVEEVKEDEQKKLKNAASRKSTRF